MTTLPVERDETVPSVRPPSNSNSTSLLSNLVLTQERYQMKAPPVLTVDVIPIPTPQVRAFHCVEVFLVLARCLPDAKSIPGLEQRTPPGLYSGYDLDKEVFPKSVSSVSWGLPELFSKLATVTESLYIGYLWVVSFIVYNDLSGVCGYSSVPLL